jgi:PAS domain S-box-containing protein
MNQLAPETERLTLRELRNRLRESEETLTAIRSGDVDGIVVDGPGGMRLFTLDTPDQPYRLLVEHMNEGAATVAYDGTILYCNSTMAEMVGLPQQKLLGAQIGEFLKIGEERGFAKLAEEAQQHKVRARGCVIGPGRSELPVLISLNEVPLDPNNKGLCIVATDMTQQSQVEEDLKRSNAELQQFAYVASHDLQEPLRMVASFTRLLAQRYEGKLDTTADEYIRFAADGAKRMQTLIEDLLDFSRVGTRQNATRLCSSKSIVENAIKNLMAAVQESGAKIEMGELPEIFVDESQLKSVFQNLIGNAIKFRSPNSLCVIRVSARQKGQHWIFSVEDNGIGIERKHFDRIFQVFQRLHQREDYPGNGIGLAICKKIVERHGGKIWLESRPGHGTTFSFTIPLVVAQQPEEVTSAAPGH